MHIIYFRKTVKMGLCKGTNRAGLLFLKQLTCVTAIQEAYSIEVLQV